MSTPVTPVRDKVCEIARVFDPACIEPHEAKRMVEECAEIERFVGAIKTLAIGCVAGTRIWGQQGDRSAAHYVARVSGTSLGEAIATIDTAARLPELSETEAALRTGKLSRVQANEVTAAAVVDPASETRLLQKARRGTFKDLKEFSARVKAAVRDDTTEHLRIRAIRNVSTWRDGDGAHLHLQSTPEDIETVLHAMVPYRQAIFDAARKSEDREPPGAYDADALVAMARDSLNCTAMSGTKSRAPSAVLNINLDFPSFQAGHTVPGGHCEIPGLGPVPVALAHSVASDAVINLIVKQGIDVKALVTLSQSVTPKMQIALDAMYPTCGERNCDVRHGLENHHITDYSLVHETRIENIVPLCSYHHDLVTYRGYTLIRGPDGLVGLVAPAQPAELETTDRSPPDREMIDAPCPDDCRPDGAALTLAGCAGASGCPDPVCPDPT
jgi:hypothetical protein